MGPTKRGVWVELAVLVAASLASAPLTAGCARSVPPLAAGPFGAGDVTVLERALDVATRRGYHAEAVDLAGGTFYVTARAEPQSVVTFEVRCTREGWVVVTPHGERVTELEDGYRMRARLRSEYLAFVAALDREMRPRPRSDEPGLRAGRGAR